MDEPNEYATKDVKALITYDLDNWPKTSLRNVTIKNCLPDATNIVKIVIKASTCIVVIALDGKSE